MFVLYVHRIHEQQQHVYRERRADFYNYGTLRVEGALNINALSSLYNYSSGTLQVTGNLNNNYRFVNDGQASVGGNYQANSGAGTQNINRGKLTVTGGIELNSAFQNSGQVSAGGNFAVNNGGSLDNQFGAKIQVKGNYTNNSTSVNNGKIYVEGNLVNNGGSVFTNNEDVEILGNFTNNGTLNGDTNGCNIFTVGGSQVIQNGGASTNNVDFCAQSFPSGNYSTNYGFVGSGTTYCNCSRSGVSPLPITLTAFKATCEGGTVEVSWTTASEINNAFFTVSRSTDAANWEPVEVVAGAGNSNATLTYRITDSRPLEGVSYYRLQQTDYDGTAESFAPVSVSCQAAAGTATLSVYPNPTTDIVRVALTSSVNESEVPVVLSDMNGRAQSIRNFNINSGQNEWTLDCSTLKNGIYTISIQSKLTRTSPIKLVVNHD